MKNLLNPLFVVLVTFSFAGCANGKKLQENPPEAIGKAYYTTWRGGVKGAGSGYNLFIPSEANLEIELDTAFFRGRKAVIEKEPSQPGLYVARFVVPAKDDPAKDIVLHQDPMKEFGNKPPAIFPEIPFELEPGEAVVKYRKNGKEKYFRITGIKPADSPDALKIKNPENPQH